MKKLTAGIFATLLAVVSVGAAHAEIASKGYVDQQVGTVSTEVDTLSTTVGEHATQIAGKADKATTLAGYGITDGATKTELTEGLAGKVDNADITDMQVKSNLVKTAGWDTGKTDDTKYPSAAAVNDAIIDATSGLANNTTITEIQGDITEIQGDVTKLQTDVSAKQDKNMGAGAANHIVTTDGTGNITSSATIANTQVSGLGTLATKSTVTSADITDGTIAEGDLNESINASLDKADTALQQAALDDYVTKEAADAAYADIATETTASTASTNAQSALTNIGTLSQLTTDAKGNTVAAINEVAKEAADAATAAAGAKTAADTAQGDVDALEAVVNHETTGLAAAHTAIDAVEGRVTTAEGEIDTIQGQISKMATSETVKGLQTDVAGLKTSKLDKAIYDSQVGTVSAGNMGTTATTVVTAIKEVAGEAEDAQSAASAADSKAQAAQSAASAADSKAQAAQETANAAIPKPDGECSNPTSKCVLTYNNSQYAWEVIERSTGGE